MWSDCRKPFQMRCPERASHAATIYCQDNANDLAILHTDMNSLAAVSFRFQPRFGEAVATYGFPYFGLLSSSGNFTLNNVIRKRSVSG